MVTKMEWELVETMEQNSVCVIYHSGDYVIGHFDPGGCNEQATVRVNKKRVDIFFKYLHEAKAYAEFLMSKERCDECSKPQDPEPPKDLVSPWNKSSECPPPKNGQMILANWTGYPISTKWVDPDITEPNTWDMGGYYNRRKVEPSWKDCTGGWIYNDPPFWMPIPSLPKT